MDNECGVYVHIPFCASKCLYCDFFSCTDKYGLQADYLAALVSELKQNKHKFLNKTITSIYIGGGTPSILPSSYITTIVASIKSNYTVSKNAEISIEANPTSVDFEKAVLWKNCGVNRVSIGMQSANDNILKAIGRAHTKKDFLLAFDAVKKAGFENINVDVMFGLPHQKQSDIKYAINLAVSLGAVHISIYGLIVEENTPLFKMVETKQVALPREEKLLDMSHFIVSHLKKLQFNRYEVSNYSLPGYECVHNLNCWNLKEYLGVGAGAHSFYDLTRFSNVSDIEKYIDCISNGKSAQDQIDKLTIEEQEEEFVFLGLRKAEGLDLAEYHQRFNKDLLIYKADEIENLLKFGLIKIENNRLFATSLGFCLLNKIILDLV